MSKYPSIDLNFHLLVALFFFGSPLRFPYISSVLLFLPPLASKVCFLTAAQPAPSAPVP